MQIIPHFEGGGRNRNSAVAAVAAKDADVVAAGRPSQTESRDVPLTKKLLALGNLFARKLPRVLSSFPDPRVD